MKNFNEFYENQINQLKMVLPKSIIEKYDIIQCISNTDENSIYIIKSQNFKNKLYHENI